MYGSQIGKCPTTDKLLLEIRNRVDREVNSENPVVPLFLSVAISDYWDCAFQVRNMKQLATLQGSIDLILAAASASDKPELRSEEIAFKKHCKVVNSDKAAPSESVLSWEKTLIHNIT